MPVRVPRGYRWLLRAVAPAHERVWLLADLEEETTARARVHGDPSARAWSRRQVLASIVPLLSRRLEYSALHFRSTAVSTFRHLISDLADATPSPLVLLFALGISLLTALVFGVGPALLTSRADPMDAMRGPAHAGAADAGAGHFACRVRALQPDVR